MEKFSSKLFDLHTHTNSSDGELTPKELIDLAIESKISGLAITDHDSISALKEAEKYSKKKGIEFIPGVEIRCHEKEFNYPIEIIGLFINPDNSKMKSLIKQLQSNRIIQKFPWKFKTLTNVFTKLLFKGKSSFVPKKCFDMKKIIRTIKDSEGISILAHPGRYMNEMEKIIDKFQIEGGQGIEINYPYVKLLNFKPQTEKKIIEGLKNLALQKNLLVSGGSDFHGNKRGIFLGEKNVSKEDFEKIRSLILQQT